MLFLAVQRCIYPCENLATAHKFPPEFRLFLTETVILKEWRCEKIGVLKLNLYLFLNPPPLPGGWGGVKN